MRATLSSRPGALVLALLVIMAVSLFWTLVLKHSTELTQLPTRQVRLHLVNACHLILI